MPSKHLMRLATDLGWTAHGDSFAGEAQNCLFTVSEEEGMISIIFHVPDLDEDSFTTLNVYLKQNQKRLQILDHAYTDDYLLVTLRKGLLPISDQKLTQLLLLVSNLAREGQGNLSRKCPICGKQTAGDQRGFYLDLYSYVHPDCLARLNETEVSIGIVTDTAESENILYHNGMQEDNNMTDKTNTSREEQLDFLMDLIRIPSMKADPVPGAPFGQETLNALVHFLEQAERDGFRTRNVDGYCGWIEFGPEDAGQMIAAVAHLDVVPVGEWTDAFEPILEDDRLVGRGSIDDKGPAVSAYYALKALKDSAYNPSNRLRLILGLDEESGSACMQRYLETEEVPVAGFTPDADFPVIHAEKGMLRFDVEMSWPQADSSKLRFVRAEAGSRANVIPGSARISFAKEDGSVETKVVEGVMGHASMPDKAKNAISLAMRDVSYRLEDAGVTHPFVDLYRDLLGLDYDGDKMGIKFSDDVSGALTLNVGVIDLNETGVKMICDIRYPVTMDYDHLVTTIERQLKTYGADFKLISHSVPLYLPTDHELVSTLTRVYNEQTGTSETPVAIGGGTYARSIPNIVAYGPCFPGEEALAHQHGEYILLDSFFRSQDIYREALRELDQAYAKKA